MSLFLTEVVTPPEHLPVEVAAADQALAAAVTEEIERGVLCRAIVAQTRRITLDGPLPQLLELEPVSGAVSLTRWTPTDDAEVIDAATYSLVSRDPTGAVIVPLDGTNWPAPERSIDSFRLTYECGWEVESESSPGAGDGTNAVPPSVQLMVDRAVKFRAGSGLGDIKIGSLDLSVAPSYSTDSLPRELTNIARAWVYRPGIIAARP